MIRQRYTERNRDKQRIRETNKYRVGGYRKIRQIVERYGLKKRGEIRQKQRQIENKRNKEIASGKIATEHNEYESVSVRLQIQRRQGQTERQD